MGVAVLQDVLEDTQASCGDAAAGFSNHEVRNEWRWDANKPAKKRRNTNHGTVDSWNLYKGHGYATFNGYSERVLFHAKDCAEVPAVGDVVTAYVHRRRRDGKHQALRVEKVDAAEEQGHRVDHVHATLLGTG